MEADDPIGKSIRNTLLRYSLPVHLEVFCRGYKKHLGTDLPHKEFGFTTPVEFLRQHYSHIVEVTPSDVNKNVHFLSLRSDEKPPSRAQTPVNGSSREEMTKPSAERIRYICNQIFGKQKSEALAERSDPVTANPAKEAGGHVANEIAAATKQKSMRSLQRMDSVVRSELTNGVYLFQVEYQGKKFIPLPCISALAGLKTDSIREQLEESKLKINDAVALSKDVSAHSKIRYELACLNCPFVIAEDGSLPHEILLVPMNSLQILIRLFSERNSVFETKLEEIRAEIAQSLKIS